MIYINFSANINPNSSTALMTRLADQLNKGETAFYILLSSTGGTVRDGLTLYNFIRSLPTRVTTHNIGMIDSIGNIVFLAGTERYAVPNSSFLFHGVSFEISQPTRFEEKQVKERLTSIERDQELIGNIIAERTKLSLQQVKKMFLETQTKTPEQAKKVGMINEIREVKIPKGAKVISFVVK